MQTPDEMIEAIEAFKQDGKVKVTNITGGNSWINGDSNVFDFGHFTYHPVPKPKEIWANEYNGIVSHAYESPDEAKGNAGPSATRIAVRYIEADPQ